MARANSLFSNRPHWKTFHNLNKDNVKNGYADHVEKIDFNLV